MFATGHVTGIVVECGYDVSSSCCVFEGDVVPGSLARIEIAGRELDTYLIRLLNERG
jgi:actin-related protein